MLDGALDWNIWGSNNLSKDGENKNWRKFQIELEHYANFIIMNNEEGSNYD